MAGTTSQPALSSVVAATRSARHARRDWTCRRCATSSRTGKPPDGFTHRSSRDCLHRPAAFTPTRSRRQLSNLRQQAIALGLGEKFEQIEDMYAAANQILGNVVKVTPSSKVVGDLALHLSRLTPTRATSRRTGKVRRPDSVLGSSEATSALRPAAGREPFAPKRWRDESKGVRGRALHRSRSRGPGAHRRSALNTLFVPWSDQGLPGLSRALRRSRGALDLRFPLRTTASRGARSRDRGGKDPHLGMKSIERARPERHPNCHVHDQRPASPDRGQGSLR